MNGSTLNAGKDLSIPASGKGSCVQEQSGIFAGQDGFDITTGNHTQLDVYLTLF